MCTIHLIFISEAVLPNRPTALLRNTNNLILNGTAAPIAVGFY